MTEAAKPDTWRTIMDRLRGDSERLLQQRVPARDAKVAADLARQVNRSVWSFVNSVEALYVDRVYDLAAILKSVADRGITVGEALVDLAEVHGITIHGSGVVKWARNHGVDPELFMTEAWRDDIEGTDKWAISEQSSKG